MQPNKLKALLTLNDLTVDDLAKQIGINKSTLFRKISGKVEFRRIEIAKIAKIFKLSAEDIYEIFFAS